MGDVLSSGGLNLLSLMLSFLLLAAGLVLWFFVNRASSRTDEQIALLEALLVQQKKQNTLLRRLYEANMPETEVAEVPAKPVEQKTEEDDFIRLVAER